MTEKVKYYFAILILTSCILTIFSQAIYFDFINYDDYTYITGNYKFKDGLTIENIKWAFTTNYFGFYYPITWLSHIIDVRLLGSDAGGHHMTSVVIHLFNSILLLYLLNLITCAFWRSFFVTLLFAIHPLHVESVVWIAERKDLLSTLFLFITLISYYFYTKKRAIYIYFLTILFFLLSLMSKSMYVTAPAIMLLLDFWPLSRIKIDDSFSQIITRYNNILLKLIIEKIPFFIFSITFSIITYLSQVDVSAISSFKAITIQKRIASAFLSYSNYITSTILPLNLSIIYRYEWHSFLDWKVILSISLVLLLTYLVLKMGLKYTYLITGWFLYVTVLIPVIGIVQVGLWSRADHYTYVSIIGLFIIAIWSLNDLFRNSHFRKAVIVILIVIIFPAMTYLSYLQCGYWKDTITLFSHALSLDKNNYIAYSITGNEYLLKGNLGMAFSHLMECFRIDPTYEQAYPHICRYFVASGKVNEGILFFKEILRKKQNNPMVMFCLGKLYLSNSKYQESLSYCLNSLRLDSKEMGNQKTNLLSIIGYLYLRLDDEKNGIYYLNAAIKDNSHNASQYYYLCYLYSIKGETGKALYYYEKAMDLKVDSLNKEVEINLIKALLKRNNKDDIQNALRIAKKDCQKTNYLNPHFLSAMSLAFQRFGDKKNASIMAKKAMESSLQSSDKILQQDIYKHLKDAGIEFTDYEQSRSGR